MFSFLPLSPVSLVVLRHSARSCSVCRMFTVTAIAQMCILGLMWVFGAFLFSEDNIALAYIFTILNSLQGALVFVMHCLLSKQVGLHGPARILPGRAGERSGRALISSSRCSAAPCRSEKSTPISLPAPECRRRRGTRTSAAATPPAASHRSVTRNTLSGVAVSKYIW